MQALGREMLGSGLTEPDLCPPEAKELTQEKMCGLQAPFLTPSSLPVSQRPSLNGQKSQGRAGGDRGWTDQGSPAPPLF